MRKFLFILASAVLISRSANADIILIQFDGSISYTDLDGTRMQQDGLLEGPASVFNATFFNSPINGGFSSPVNQGLIILWTRLVNGGGGPLRPATIIESNFRGPEDLSPEICGVTIPNCTPTAYDVIYDAFDVLWSDGTVDKFEFRWDAPVPEPTPIVLTLTTIATLFGQMLWRWIRATQYPHTTEPQKSPANS